jgi:hypothetical protein
MGGRNWETSILRGKTTFLYKYQRPVDTDSVTNSLSLICCLLCASELLIPFNG